MRNCIEHVHDRFTDLHDQEILVTRSKIRGSTMQARPILTPNSLFEGFSKYRLKIAIHVRDSDLSRVDGLDDDVLIGWLAHEFGHLLDYQKYSVLGMAWYGIRYVLSRPYAKRVEERADIYAVHHGFYDEVRRTKEYLLSNHLGEKYRRKLFRNYMSIEDLEVCNLEFEGRLPD